MHTHRALLPIIVVKVTAKVKVVTRR